MITEPIFLDGYSLIRTDNSIVIQNIEKGTETSILLIPPKNIVGRLNIQLSNVCNMNCRYCSEGIYNRNKKQEVCVKNAQAVIVTYLNYIASLPWNIKSIRLSFDYGGEPFCLLSKMTRIIFFFRNQCTQRGITPLVQITTNGVWTVNCLDVIQSSVDECIVSIDGPRELHEKYRIHSSGTSVFDLIVSNTQQIHKLGKLLQVSAVVTRNTIEHILEFVSFFVDNFPNTTIRIRPIMTLGDALSYGMSKIPMNEWSKFVAEVRRLSGNRIRIIDTKPEKCLHLLYQYGCEYINTASWFYWLDGSISCCTERESTQYCIGKCESSRANINQDMLDQLRIENNVEVLPKCNDCLAKYYCSGGCPKMRKRINCDTRRRKYAKLLINQIKEK